MLKSFKRPAAKWLPSRPFLSEGDKKELRLAANFSKISFLRVAAGDFAGSTVTALFANEYDFVPVLGRSLYLGLDFALFPLIDRAAYLLFKPKLSRLRVYVPWTAATSIVSMAIVRTVKVAVQNKYINNSWSLRGWTAGAARSFSHRAGFNTAYGLTRHFLPPASKMGGAFARDTASVALAGFGGAVLEWTVSGFRYPVSQLVLWYIAGLPNLLLNMAMFSTRHEFMQIESDIFHNLLE
jgi:hypothetical protein